MISVSGGFTLVPDASSEFAAIFFSRLLRTYGTLIFNAAGNTSHALGSVHSYGDVLSVGGVMSPVTYAALYGGRPLERTIVHPISAAGPALDGAIKPDFLVPMERIATDLPWRASVQSLPRSAPEHRVPPGYQISCCTSATSPYAAGLAALLISAARQTGVRYSADGIARALRVTATALPDVPAHAQGNGVADINAAWRLLSNDADPPRIAASTHIAHPLAQYMVNGALGTGLFEFAGWFGGMRGNRTVTLRRTSGPAQPVNYTVSWTSGDGTFQSADDITLPLNAAAPLAVVIDVKSAGAHSALLNLVDPATGAVVFRSQATVAASEPFGPSGSVRVTGTLPLLSQRAHYFHVPPGTSAVAFDLVVTRGVVGPTILRSHGLSGDYYPHVHPMNTFFDGPGRYHLVMPNPEPGTWTVKLDNRSVWANLAPAFGPRDGSDAEYALTVDLASSVVRTRAGRRNRLSVDVVNSGRPLRQPEIELWPATVLTSSGTFRSDGLPRTFEIAVAPETAALLLQVDSSRTTSELYLYDCTTGECFSYDIGFPAARSHRIVVRKPAAGRWIAAINAAPFPAAEGSFGFETVMTAGRPTRAALLQDRLNSWHAEVERPASISPGRGVPALLVQLVDRAIEADATGHPWSRAPHFIQLRDRPVAIGIAVHRR